MSIRGPDHRLPRQGCGAPARLPGLLNFVAVAPAAAATIIGSERTVQITVLAVYVELQYATAILEVGGVVCQVVIRPPDLAPPEWHDLHETLGARPRDSKAIEGTFDLNHGEHKFGRQITAQGRPMDQIQQLQSLRGARHKRRQARRQVDEPDFCSKAIPKAVALGNRAFEEAPQRSRIISVSCCRLTDSDSGHCGQT